MIGPAIPRKREMWNFKTPQASANFPISMKVLERAEPLRQKQAQPLQRVNQDASQCPGPKAKRGDGDQQWQEHPPEARHDAFPGPSGAREGPREAKRPPQKHGLPAPCASTTG